MIGQAYPYKDTGWSILEEGKLGYLPDSPLPQLIISHYLITNPSGESIHQTNTKEQAMTWLTKHTNS